MAGTPVKLNFELNLRKRTAAYPKSFQGGKKPLIPFLSTLIFPWSGVLKVVWL